MIYAPSPLNETDDGISFLPNRKTLGRDFSIDSVSVIGEWTNLIPGTDTPEKNQPFGNASRKRLVKLVARKEVRVEFNKHDRYGRIVGKVWVRPPGCFNCGKTLDVGLAQVTVGMAWWYRKYAREQSPEDQGRYEFAEKEAKAKEGRPMSR